MKRKCPKCGLEYTGHPALSRDDNETLICPDCGVREAMTYMGVSQEDTEQVLAVIHKYRQKEK